MAESTFTLNEAFVNPLSFAELLEVTETYNSAIKNDTFTLPEHDTVAFKLWAKREKINFGPYQNLTFFEISNRLHSDLVLLEAAKILFKEHHVKSVQLKMSNHAGNDLTVIDKKNNTINGEAFNTASSFFQLKMRSELKKFDKIGVGIIAFNESALSEKNMVFLDRKKLEYPKVLFVGCKI